MSHAAPAFTSSTYRRIIESVRLELEVAGNPAYMVVILDAEGGAHGSPLIYSAIGPAAQHATRTAPTLGPGESMIIISRHASRTRQTYNLHEPAGLKKLHIQNEVIEASVLETHGPV